MPCKGCNPPPDWLAHHLWIARLDPRAADGARSAALVAPVPGPGGEAFVWLRLYQAQLHGLVPAGPDDRLWWMLRRPFRLRYHAAYRMFHRVGASLGANWSLHDLRHPAACRMTRDPAVTLPLAAEAIADGDAQLAPAS